VVPFGLRAATTQQPTENTMSNKTDLQLAMQTAYESTFGESTIPLNVGGIDFPKRPDELSDRQLCGLLRYGKRAGNDSYNSEAKKLRDSGEPVPNPKDWFPDWLADLGTNKPRGGGARLSVETSAWIEFFKSKASPVRFKNETPNGKTVDKYIDAFVRNAIWPSVKSAIKDLSQEEQRQFHKEKLPELIKKHRQTVMQKAEASQTLVKPFIDAENRKRNGTTASNTFAVEIDINI
jgi:hypothetical protein